MKKLIIGLGVIAGMLLLSGCVSPNMKERPTMVTKVKGRHYVIPKPSYGKWKPLGKKSAKQMNNLYGLKCRAGDLRITAEADTTMQMVMGMGKENTVRKRGAVLLKAAREGKIMCIHPQPWSWTKQRNRYEAQQRRINNDPRVVAARIQANAINKQAMMARWNNLGEGYNTSNYYKSNQNTGFSYPDYGSDDSFSLNRKSTTYRATRLSDGVYNVRKRNSAPRF